MKLMIVDDSRTMRLLIRRALRQSGYGTAEVKEASNGREAADMVDEFAPDLVLCDWNMPEMTGIELLKELRERNSRVKFGFVTSEGSDEIRTEAASNGALFVITKPFTPQAFETALDQALA